MNPQPETTLQLHQRVQGYLKTVLVVIMFIFSLGVGYQRLESNIAAADASTNAKVDRHLAEEVAQQAYLQKELADIKAKLYDIERYLRDKK